MPNDKPQTLADICARIRTIDESMMRDLDFIAVFLEFLPRDIEAAAERERDEDRQLAAIAESDEEFARCARCDRPERSHGNAAAMRESIETMRRYAMLPQEQLSLSLLQRTIHEKCDAALAAPARNCDRFASIGAAIDGFCREVQDWEDHDGIPDYYELAKWLFAPAEKGGDYA